MWRTATLWWTFLLVNKAYFSKQAQSLKKKIIVAFAVVIINEVQVELVLVLWLIALINCLAKKCVCLRNGFQLLKKRIIFHLGWKHCCVEKSKKILKTFFNEFDDLHQQGTCLFCVLKKFQPIIYLSSLSPLLLPKGWLPKAILEEWKTTDVFTFLPHWNFKIHSYLPLLTYPWSSCWW